MNTARVNMSELRYNIPITNDERFRCAHTDKVEKEMFVLKPKTEIG